MYNHQTDWFIGLFIDQIIYFPFLNCTLLLLVHTKYAKYSDEKLFYQCFLYSTVDINPKIIKALHIQINLLLLILNLNLENRAADLVL